MEPANKRHKISRTSENQHHKQVISSARTPFSDITNGNTTSTYVSTTCFTYNHLFIFLWLHHYVVAKSSSSRKCTSIKSTHLGPGRHVIKNTVLQHNIKTNKETLRLICTENAEETIVPSNSSRTL